LRAGTQGIMFNWVEVLRWKDMRNPGSVSEARTHAAPRCDGARR
jgi:hypothetical protein